MTSGIVYFVQEEMNRQGLTERELASRSKLDHSTVNRILAGAREPAMSSLQKLAYGLGFDFYSFILAASGLQDVRESEMMRVYQRLQPVHQQLLLEIAWQFPEAATSDRVAGSEIFVEP